MSACSGSLSAILVFAANLSAEIYVPPDNVLDPAKKTEARSADYSLPFIYLEPYDCCYDIAQPLRVTIYAVNRSGGELTVDWNSIVGALSLEAVGPGAATPTDNRPRLEVTALPRRALARQEINLKNFFQIRGASVYRLSFSKPLDDGRIHFAKTVTFLVEDEVALEKFAESLEAGPGRNTAVEMLKHNPIFACGIEPKTYGNDSWWQEPEMNQIRSAGSYTAARACWDTGLKELSIPESSADGLRAMEAIVDRILFLSDDFRVPPTRDLFPWNLREENQNLATAHERIWLKLVRSHDARMTSEAIGRLSNVEVYRHHEPALSAETIAAIEALFKIADSANKELASEALSRLSDYRANAKITQFLQRKMTDSDADLGLKAAIISCYSGDWSGLPVIFRCVSSDDPKLRLKAISQLGDPRFRAHATKIVPLLLAEIKTPLSDAHLERAVDALGSYRGQELKDALTPLLQHQNERVRARQALSGEHSARNLGKVAARLFTRLLEWLRQLPAAAGGSISGRERRSSRR